MQNSIYDSKLYTNNLYTWGYEQSKIEDLLKLCDEYKIGLVIDVRIKRKTRFWEFDEANLKGQVPLLAYSLEKAGIQYRYLQDLGNTADNLIHLKLLHETRGLNLLESLVVAQKIKLDNPNVLLLCTEKDYTICHRLYITEKIKEMLPGLWVQHL